MEEMAKPQCGGGKEAGEYDVGLHTAGLCERPNMSRGYLTCF